MFRANLPTALVRDGAPLGELRAHPTSSRASRTYAFAAIVGSYPHDWISQVPGQSFGACCPPHTHIHPHALRPRAQKKSRRRYCWSSRGTITVTSPDHLHTRMRHRALHTRKLHTLFGSITRAHPTPHIPTYTHLCALYCTTIHIICGIHRLKKTQCQRVKGRVKRDRRSASQGRHAGPWVRTRGDWRSGRTRGRSRSNRRRDRRGLLLRRR